MAQSDDEMLDLNRDAQERASAHREPATSVRKDSILSENEDLELPESLNGAAEDASPDFALAPKEQMHQARQHDPADEEVLSIAAVSAKAQLN